MGKRVRGRGQAAALLRLRLLLCPAHVEEELYQDVRHCIGVSTHQIDCEDSMPRVKRGSLGRRVAVHGVLVGCQTDSSNTGPARMLSEGASDRALGAPTGNALGTHLSAKRRGCSDIR